MRQCTLPTLQRFRATCHAAELLVHDELERRYRYLLSPFICDIPRFRAELDTTVSFIAGEATLRFSLNINPTIQHIDVHTSRANLFHMLGYLIYVEHYILVQFNAATSSPNQTGVHRVVQLSRASRTINVVQSLSDSALYPIPSLWCTVLMTCLGGSTFFVPYPGLLEDHRTLLTPDAINSSDGEDLTWLEPLIPKFISYGLAITLLECDMFYDHELPSACARENSATCPLTVRWTGDRFGLLGTFSSAVTRFDNRVDHINGPGLRVVWWRGGPHCGGRCSAGAQYQKPRVRTLRKEYIA
ncbi:hypothetical protein FKP32DRAFT_1581438 [Trametes sanguinea]|nr:hypothetical protein FKP32DRAFT_1581438 [Trametes sanguinea]